MTFTSESLITAINATFAVGALGPCAQINIEGYCATLKSTCPFAGSSDHEQVDSQEKPTPACFSKPVLPRSMHGLLYMAIYRKALYP